MTSCATSPAAVACSSWSTPRGVKGRHPIEDLQSLRREINLYDERLSERPWCIVANKIDLPDYDENLRAIEQRFTGVPVIRVSAERGEGIEELKTQLRTWLPEATETNYVPSGKAEWAAATD